VRGGRERSAVGWYELSCRQAGIQFSLAEVCSSPSLRVSIFQVGIRDPESNTAFVLHLRSQTKAYHLARTDLENERISRSGGFEACYEIIRGVGWSEFQLKSQNKSPETHPLGKMSNPGCCWLVGPVLSTAAGL
jgi:hypothetical protein